MVFFRLFKGYSLRRCGIVLLIWDKVDKVGNEKEKLLTFKNLHSLERRHPRGWSGYPSKNVMVRDDKGRPKRGENTESLEDSIGRVVEGQTFTRVVCTLAECTNIEKSSFVRHTK